ncbi:MAG: hypothetical protein M1821_004406 [Bathelium mastoideum]|nr:MAG: hypothetical protein M1821_004406 [Bathelium mastoideum]
MGRRDRRRSAKGDDASVSADSTPPAAASSSGGSVIGPDPSSAAIFAADPVGNLVPKLLYVLNDAGPPLLDYLILSAIYSRVISHFAADPLNPTEDELIHARVPLAAAITAVKQGYSPTEASFPVLLEGEDTGLDDVATKPAPDVSEMPNTPTLDQFLGEISTILRSQDGNKLKDFLLIEPPYSPIYQTMIDEIRNGFPKDKHRLLEYKIETALPEAQESADGSSWSAFVAFMLQYFIFLRDVNMDDLLRTYFLLTVLVARCNTALGHPSMGIVILPTVIAYSQILSRLSIGLEKQAKVMEPLKRKAIVGGGGRETLPEKATNIMRQAFVTCLNDRTGGINGLKDGKPAGKKVAIYTIANLCLKILFDCKKTRNAETFFSNIYAQAPPLATYPASERVTYLYYLGRFQFINGHYYRAVLALDAAYAQCLPSATKQRRLILIFLITSNIILGRFPSKALYERPEAEGLAEKFEPICKAIAKGDLATFRQLTSVNRPQAEWFLHYRILLQLGSRCEVLVWRSLCRKVFLLTGAQGDMNSRKAPTLNLKDVVAAACFLEQRAMLPPERQAPPPGQRHTNWIFESQQPHSSDVYIDPDFQGAVDPKEVESMLPNMMEVESVLTSLINQGLLGGFISHKQQKFAIQGAKKKGPLAAGFPNVWEVIKSKNDNEVPGWKVEGGGAILGSSQDS